MATFWSVGIVAALLGELLLLAAVLGLARELGIVLSRAGPTRARPTTHGLDIGMAVEPFTVEDVYGQHRVIGADKHPVSQLLIFMSPRCPSCRTLIAPTKVFAKAYRGNIQVTIIVRPGEPETAFQWAEQLKPVQVTVMESDDLHEKMYIEMTPYAILLDRDNSVTARGIVNTLEQLESLVAVAVHVTRHSVPSITAPTANGAIKGDSSTLERL